MWHRCKHPLLHGLLAFVGTLALPCSMFWWCDVGLKYLGAGWFLVVLFLGTPVLRVILETPCWRHAPHGVRNGLITLGIAAALMAQADKE